MRTLLLSSAFLLVTGCSGGPDAGASSSGAGSGPGGADPATPGSSTSPTAPSSSSSVPAAPTGGGSSTPDGGSGSTPPGAEPAGVFVAVGYGARRVRSIDDGKTWIDDVSAVPSGGDDSMLLRAVVHTGTEFIGLGYRAVRSTDGKTWQPLSSPFSQWIGAAVWQNGHVVAVGGYGLRATSADGTSWSNKPIDTVATHAHDALAFGGGRFASTNDDGARASSADGVTWNASSGATGTPTSEIAYGNGVFVALGNTSVVRSTDGGVSFSAAATLAAGGRGLVFAQGHFTVLAEGKVFTSPDGLIWTTHASTSAHRGLVVYGHGTYVSLAQPGRQRSTDGLVWEAPIGDGTNQNSLEAITFGPL